MQNGSKVVIEGDQSVGRWLGWLDDSEPFVRPWISRTCPRSGRTRLKQRICQQGVQCVCVLCLWEEMAPFVYTDQLGIDAPSSVSLDPATICHPLSQKLAPLTSTPATACPIRPQCVMILKRLPRASRDLAARKLATILEQVTAANDVTNWMHLLYFGSCCLRVPKRGGRRWNLARLINQQLAEESDPPLTLSHQRPAPHSTI